MQMEIFEHFCKFCNVVIILHLHVEFAHLVRQGVMLCNLHEGKARWNITSSTNDRRYIWVHWTNMTRKSPNNIRLPLDALGWERHQRTQLHWTGTEMLIMVRFLRLSEVFRHFDSSQNQRSVFEKVKTVVLKFIEYPSRLQSPQPRSPDHHPAFRSYNLKSTEDLSESFRNCDIDSVLRKL